MNNLNIETEGTEEEATEGLEDALGMELDQDGEGGGEEEEQGYGTERVLGALDFITQDAEPSRETLVGACNGFNKLSRLEMLWTVQHHWPARARFAFNWYRHWAPFLLRQPGEPPVTILIREGVNQGDPLSMLLYGIILVPLAKELRAANLRFLSPFYASL